MTVRPRCAWGSETQAALCGWVGSKLAHSIRQANRGTKRVFDVDPVDLIIARARETTVRSGGLRELTRRGASEVVGAETGRVSGRAFVFVDQAAEQVVAL
jgi:hypothetical protein